MGKVTVRPSSGLKRLSRGGIVNEETDCAERGEVGFEVGSVRLSGEWKGPGDGECN
jgi:hypothetical protein